MAVRVTRSAGMLLLGIWLILTGLTGFAPLPIPGVVDGGPGVDRGDFDSGWDVTILLPPAPQAPSHHR
jgi:hypothetical protein